MKIVRKFFMQNPFFRNDEKTQITAILISEFENGKSTKEQVEFEKYKDDGTLHPYWSKIMEEVGEESINENTRARHQQKLQQHEQKQLKIQQEKQISVTEKLFNMKLQVFEMPHVRNCKNRQLRSLLRSAKNEFELNAYITMILMDYMNDSENQTL